MINKGHLFRSINLLNVLLLGGVVIFAHYMLMPMLDLKVQYLLPARAKTLKGETKEISVAYRVPSISDYLLIADNNLFHPGRKIPPDKIAENQTAPLPKPDIVLYGTVISDDIRLAYIEDLKSTRSTPGRGNRQTAVKIGDNLSGFILKEIEADRIALVRGDEKMLVSVLDSQRRKMKGASGTHTGTHTASNQHYTKPLTPESDLLQRNRTPVTPSSATSLNSSIALPPAPFEKKIFDFLDQKRGPQ
jgi:hypothetical protein